MEPLRIFRPPNAFWSGTGSGSDRVNGARSLPLPVPYRSLNPIERLNRLLQRFVLFDKWEHAALAVVNLPSFFQYFFGPFPGHDHDAVFISHDYIARAHRHAPAFDGYISGHGRVMPHGGPRGYRARIDRQPHPADVPHVADGAV